MKYKLLCFLLLANLIAVIFSIRESLDHPSFLVYTYANGFQDGHDAGYGKGIGKPIPLSKQFPHRPEFP